MRVKWIVNLMIIILLCVVALLGLASRDSAVASQESSEKIEGLLLDQFTTDGSADFIMRFSEQVDLSAAYSMDWDVRGEYVYNTLNATACMIGVGSESELMQDSEAALQIFLGENYETN